MATTITPPADIAAVQSAGKNYIFYITEKNEIAYYSGGSVQEAQGGDTYEKHEKIQTRIDGTRVTAKTNATNKDIAAVAYTVGTHKEIRVYYISPQNIVTELCLTNDGEWVRGDLGIKRKLKVVDGSSLSANVSGYKDPRTGHDLDYLKVFCNGDEAEGHLVCIFRQTDLQVWSQSTLTGPQYDPVF